MIGWVEVATIAFVAQLTVLPGEKVQFIIAGLATRYHPLVVASAAGAAFAGWTVLEIAFGSYLQQVFPGIVLDVMTGLLFLLFAVMLWRSAPSRNEAPIEAAGDIEGAAVETNGGTVSPETDGGMLAAGSGELDVRVPLVDRRVPNALGGWLPIFAMMAFGEFGDKTQLVTIGLATQYAAFPTAIWAGEMAAIIPMSLLNAYFFHRFSHRFDVRKAHYFGAALFAFFGIDTLQAKVTGISAWETIIRTVSEAGLAVLATI
ncbi:MAG: TMEM165/GDT1 family protein [Haloferacaceae archaeon]